MIGGSAACSPEIFWILAVHIQHLGPGSFRVITLQNTEVFFFSSKLRIVELPILTIDITDVSATFMDGWHPILTLLEIIISIYLTIKVRLGKWSPPDH